MTPGFVLALLFYFLLALAVAALLLIPSARDWLWERLAALRLRAMRWRHAAGGANPWQRPDGAVHPGGPTGGGAFKPGWALSLPALAGRGLLLWAGLALVVLLPLAAWLWRSQVPLDTFDHTATRPRDERVAALLQGEQLVPPPPLPPELFETGEVARQRPLVRYASREWGQLDAEFRQRLLELFFLMRKQHNVDLVLLEGYRSPQRQQALAAMGGQVTRAGAYQSYHQYGLAADVAFFRDGRIVISELDPWAAQAYGQFGQLAQSLGLVWGGSWRTIKDLGHVELRRPGVLGTASGGDNTPAVTGASH